MSSPRLRTNVGKEATWRGPNTATGHQKLDPLHHPRMNLPQELLDEILSHIPSWDRSSLRQCSLVSKSWLEPSRRRLFSYVYIHSNYTYEPWLKNVSPANTGLLRHVRSLEYTARSYDSECVPGMPDHSPTLLFDDDYLLPGRCLQPSRLFSLILSTQYPRTQKHRDRTNHHRTSRNHILNLPTHSFVVDPHKFYDHMECIRCASWILPPSSTS